MTGHLATRAGGAQHLNTPSKMNKGLIQEERRKAEEAKRQQTGPTVRQHIELFNKLIRNPQAPKP